jgi:hypothetical protein
MITQCPRILTAAALAAIGLLLSACTSSAPQPGTQAASPHPSAVSKSPVTAAVAAAASSDTATPLSTSSSTAKTSLASAWGSHAIDVPDVGDGAFGIFEGPIAVVNFYKDNTLVAVELATGGVSNTAPSKDQTTALAKLAAGRI